VQRHLPQEFPSKERKISVYRQSMIAAAQDAFPSAEQSQVAHAVVMICARQGRNLQCNHGQFPHANTQLPISVGNTGIRGRHNRVADWIPHV
jgi:hypothetical protein